jgi:UDP-2,3-diacylglucosamine pyrophosphatase LpxH
MSHKKPQHTVENLELNDRHLFIISDLHISRGREKSGLYTGTENFFADASFARWIDYCIEKSQHEKATLIINGDFIDFLRVIFQPKELQNLNFLEWSVWLKKVDIHKTPQELQNSVEYKDENKYGFKTDDFKSIWKLQQVALGHPKLFAALGKWMSQPNHNMIIVKGNHDFEWYWPKVQAYFSVLVQENRVPKSNVDFSQNDILFYQDSLIINQKIYIEHGHQYDTFTSIVGSDTLEGSQSGQLRLPLGSFVNRYLLNRIEIDYPFLDNVRPTSNILPILIRERFPLAIELVFKRLFYILKFIKKQEFLYVFGHFLTFIGLVLVPIGITAYLIFKEYQTGSFSDISLSWLSPLKNLGLLVLSYLFGRLLVKFRLTEPSDLSKNAFDIFTQYPHLQIVTMGHTHNPYQLFFEGKAFFNTGTWIPIVENSSAAIRQDRTFTFLYIQIDENQNCLFKPLLRWNDDANRADEIEISTRI